MKNEFAVYQSWSHTFRPKKASLNTHTSASRMAQVFENNPKGRKQAIESIMPATTVLFCKLPPEHIGWTGKQVLDYCEENGAGLPI